MANQAAENGSSIEIAVHGRGGQAAKTAGEMLTYTLYRIGFKPHGQPRYTPDRMGAPVSYAIRFHPGRSDIFDRSWIKDPQMVVLFDLSLIEQLDLTALWRPGITIVANAKPEAAGLASLAGYHVAHLDGNRIARDLRLVKGSVPILSTTMSGAFARVSGLMSLDDLLETIREVSKGAVGRHLEANLEAARRGYAEVVLPDEA